MVTDVVCEQLLKKERETRDYVMIVLIIMAAVALSAALLIIFLSGATLLFPFSIGGIIGVGYLARKFIRKLNVEYEYCFVNGDLTIDKIAGEEKRYRVTEINIRQIDEAGRVTPEFVEQKKHSIKNCARVAVPENGIYLKWDGRYYVLSPDERVMKAMKGYFKPMVQRAVYISNSPKAD